MITLFELCGEDTDVRFSPFVWRIRLILENKGISFNSEPVTFLNKDAMAGSGFEKVPTIRHGDQWLTESFKIARYLDEQFPEKSIFKGASKTQALLLNNWVDRHLVAPIFPMIAADIVKVLGEEDYAFFRKSREAVLGRTLEEAAEGRHDARENLIADLASLESILAETTFFGGDEPDFLDLCILGSLMWPHVVSSFDPIEGSTALTDWRKRMIGVHPKDLTAVKRGV